MSQKIFLYFDAYKDRTNSCQNTKFCILPNTVHLIIFLQDVRVLHNIVDQVSERPLSKSTHLSEFGDDDEDDDETHYKEIIAEHLNASIKVLCIWDCCHIWIKIAQLFSYLVFDPFTELFITLCIIVNVIFMAMDHYDIEFDPNDPNVTVYM